MQSTRRLMWIGVVVMALGSHGAVFAQGYGGGSKYNKPAAGLVAAFKTAQTHATNAARAETLRDSLWHLGHVVNCMEGPRGTHYDATTANPCQGQGTGIIPDLEAMGGQMGASSALDGVRKADTLALDTLKLTDLAKVKAGAEKVATMLTQASRAIGQ
ncbi:MAG: hypothetical protein AUH31_06855 [Armatimonadetes bacterium 13_1_40CM_64_14]|nr:MAG: hypothetical protein AUH31_06855 [Armatimonadetes bacterium 13_1_40CM_64_14]